MRDQVVIMIAPLSSPSLRTRLAKMVPLINDHGLRVRFFGWQREKNDKSRALPGASLDESAILHGGGYASRKARLMYPLWMLMVFWCVLRLGRGQSIFCLGWETAFPARLAATFTGAQIIFDDADRFSMSISLPSPLRSILQRLERWTSFACDLHIVPGFTRYEWRNEQMVLLRNTPSRRDFEAAREIAPERPSAAIVLYANGWIGETRGARVFLDLLDRAFEEKQDMRLVIAGRIEGPSAKRLVEHPFVQYIGQVDQTVALSWYSAVDLLLSYYDPSVPINRQAESNKWGDAVYFGTPFIVNSEVETAKQFVDDGAAFSLEYSDTAALFTLIKDLAIDRKALLAAKNCLASFKEEFPIFDEGLSQILRRLTQETP